MQLDGIRQKVFLDRYALKDKDGSLLEHDPEETWRRVARGIASSEKTKDRKHWEEQFYHVMEDFKFVPGGRIYSGAGTDYQVTYFNCFVIPSPKDSREGILESLKQLVEIQSRAGGVGLNLSSLRPRGARVKKVNGTSSGPVTWAGLFSYATHDVVQQGGCFSGDTRIMTHLGLVPIKEIVETKRKWYVATHQGYREVTAKFDNGTKKLYEVKTKAGLSVKTTAEHKFLTVNKSGHFSLKKLADFTVGDPVVMLLGDWIEDIPQVSLRTDIPIPSKFSYGRRKINLPKVLDENLAFLVGTYDADGAKVKDEYSPHGKGIKIAVAQNRPQDKAKLVNTIQKVFGIDPFIKQGDGAVENVTVYAREINEFLHMNGLLKHYSVDVEVPQLIYASPKKVVEAYIAGVFFGDGTNRDGKGGLRIATVSKKFASQLQMLLMNLEVAAKVSTQNRSKNNWLPLYTVSVNGNRFMKRFAQFLRPYNEKVTDNPISFRDATFNWPFNLTEQYLYLSGFQRTIARTNATTSHKAVAFLQQHMTTIAENQKPDVELLTSTVADSIASITPLAEDTVYDLEVEDVHLLSGNGFYTSNSRRGATMLMLWDWHPDIEEFITVKQDLTKINGANLSVCVSDAFMEAVKKDGDWDLVYPDIDDSEYDEKWNGEIDQWKALGKKVKVYKTIKAKSLWNLICTAAWRSAEPGLHFLERSNKRSNTWYFERLVATNPCGEQPLGPWAVCNLGAMNLSAYVKPARNASTSVSGGGWEFNYESFGKDVQVAMRFLDNVIDKTYYFFKENEKCAKDIRRTGLGIMGLGDAMIKMKIRYGSKDSEPVIEKIFQTLRDNAYQASVAIAKEKGAFPKFDKEKYLQGYHIKALSSSLRKQIGEHGIRNAVLLTIAPTGTTSLVAGVSSGIEPVYEFEFIRRWRGGEETMYHPLFEAWKKAHPGEEKPGYFASANDLTPIDHAKVQAIAQEYIDSSISKTVNAPKTHTVSDVQSLYMMAYDMGLKGVTYMRDGSRTGVLERVDPTASSGQGKSKEEKPVIPTRPVMERPMMMQGVTYQALSPVGKTYVTINHDASGEPFEVFINNGKTGSDVAAMADALGRMISFVLRLHSPVPQRERMRRVVSELVGLGGSSSIGFGENRVRSLPDTIAKVLAKHCDFRVNGQVEDKKSLAAIQEAVAQVAAAAPVTNGQKNNVTATQTSLDITLEQLTISETGVKAAEAVTNTNLFDICPECGAGSLAYEEGCKKCYACGYSAC